MLACLFSILVDQAPSSSPLRYIQKTKLLIFLSVGCFPNLDSVICLFPLSFTAFSGLTSELGAAFAQSSHRCCIQSYSSWPPGTGVMVSIAATQWEIMFAQHLCMTGHFVLKIQPVLFALMCSSLYVKMLIISDSFEVDTVPLHFGQSQGLFPSQN